MTHPWRCGGVDRQLLQDARHLLGKMLQVHIDSVRIGALEAVCDGDIAREEIERTRALIEMADTLSAGIDQALMTKG